MILTDFELTAECLACILRQVLEASEEASKDTGLRYQAVRDTVIYLNTASCQERDHVRVASELHRIVREATGNPDPYCELKRMSNRVALEWLSKSRGTVGSDLGLMDAVSIAALGNMIDYGAMRTFESPAGLITKAVDTRMDPEVLVQLERLVKASRHVLYLCDNAGEIAFDKVLVSKIQSLGPEVTVAVRGGPIMNDATMDDALDVEMTKLANTITTGAAVCGIVLAVSSQEFLEVFNEADLIVSKGQGNVESLVRINRKPTTIYISKVKCDPIARRFGCKVGSTMTAIEKAGSTEHRSDGVL